jgi:hypothetical protein
MVSKNRSDAGEILKSGLIAKPIDITFRISDHRHLAVGLPKEEVKRRDVGLIELSNEKRYR